MWKLETSSAHTLTVESRKPFASNNYTFERRNAHSFSKFFLNEAKKVQGNFFIIRHILFQSIFICHKTCMEGIFKLTLPACELSALNKNIKWLNNMKLNSVQSFRDREIKNHSTLWHMGEIYITTVLRISYN